MAGPFGAQPSAYVVAGDLGLMAEQFGGLFELLDALSGAADAADERERRGKVADIREVSRPTRRVILQESAQLFPVSSSRTADYRVVEDCMAVLAAA